MPLEGAIPNQNAPEDEPNPRDIAKKPIWVRLIDGLKARVERRRAEKEKESPQDRASRRTANATICIAIFTAVAASIGIAQWRALRSTDERIGEQVTAMRDQLEEMKTESAIRRSELAATMHLAIDRQPTPGHWSITSQWMNIGKTNAINLMGWEDFKIFRTKDDYDMLNPMFLSETPSDKSKIWARGVTVIPNSPISPLTKYIPEQDAWDIAYGKNTLAILWGYVEYADIFGEVYTVKYCVFFNFTLVGQQLSIDDPHGFAAECTQRTQEHGKEQSRR